MWAERVGQGEVGVHPNDANSMAVSGLVFWKALVGTVWAYAGITYIDKIKHFISFVIPKQKLVLDNILATPNGSNTLLFLHYDVENMLSRVKCCYVEPCLRLSEKLTTYSMAKFCSRSSLSVFSAYCSGVCEAQQAPLPPNHPDSTGTTWWAVWGCLWWQCTGQW